MEVKGAVKVTGLKKKYRGFSLEIPELTIPEGFATALIGENGAGKTTLLNIMAGLRLDYQGNLEYFGRYDDREKEKTDCPVKELIGYTGPGCYYLPNWTVGQVRDVTGLLFDNFHPEKFDRICGELGIGGEEAGRKEKKASALSDGNRMKLMLAGVLARDTKLLLLDEPASPLDPLMRDKLCEIIQEYLEQGNGERTVFFSTHNIMDMESVTDYAIIMEHGRVVEQGFVEDLKEKYVLVKGEAQDAEAAEKVLFSMTRSPYGFEGICLADQVEKLAGMDVAFLVPSLFQISVAVMKANTDLKFR